MDSEHWELIAYCNIYNFVHNPNPFTLTSTYVAQSYLTPKKWIHILFCIILIKLKIVTRLLIPLVHQHSPKLLIYQFP